MAINTAGQTLLQTVATGLSQFASGSITYDATAITAADYTMVTCGFIPRYIAFHNDTDRILVEWRDGMAQDSCIKTVAAGTRTLEVTGGNHGIIVGTIGLTSANSNVVPLPGQFQVSQNATLAIIAASKVIRWSAWG